MLTSVFQGCLHRGRSSPGRAEYCQGEEVYGHCPGAAGHNRTEVRCAAHGQKEGKWLGMEHLNSRCEAMV